MKASLPQHEEAADRAVGMVLPDMVVGLGTGPLVETVVEKMAAAVKAGRLPGVVAIPACLAVAERARALGLPLSSLEDHGSVDLVIESADEVDAKGRAIKRAGTFLQEKVLAQMGKKVVWMAESSALSPTLGTNGPVPVEVVAFAQQAARRRLEKLGARVELRTNVLSKAFRTEHNNLILDADFGPIPDPSALASAISSTAGVVEQGLFLDLDTQVIEVKQTVSASP
ncbi:MAG: ribose 5-phosphate isomerase A [Deltaproteobacteria bacterium]|nr:ribose 5-phosphate isomerase A [Deltaproteobacteria bacterium]